MSRCVLIVDSATGKMIDVAGNPREGGRYRKFAGRMMSADKNPVIDYGTNGGDRLEISNGGYDGEEINLKAQVVNISGDLRVGGVTMTSTGKLDSIAAYPAWDRDSAYADKSVVSHVGKLWIADGDVPAGTEPGEDEEESSGTWKSVTIGDLISEGVDVVPPSTTAQHGQAADAKDTGDALALKANASDVNESLDAKLDGEAAYPAWSDSEPYSAGDVVSHAGNLWKWPDGEDGSAPTPEPSFEEDSVWVFCTIQELKQDTLGLTSYLNVYPQTAVNGVLREMNPHVRVSIGGTEYNVPQSDKVVSQLLLKANATEVDAAIAGVRADLPYRLVELGEWEFSGEGAQSGVVYTIDIIQTALGDYRYILDGTDGTYEESGIDYPTDDENLIYFSSSRITATRNVLHDRAVNAVSVSTDTTLTLPPAVPGKARDFYVRLTVSAESAVTFAATDSGGDAVAWDSMGDPSAMLAAGTYLYRFTEVADGVFHAADITNGGSVDPAVLDEKLDASSAAPPFSESLTYLVGEYVTYGGVLYRCKTAVTVAGSWTGTSNWEVDDMTSPDATLDIMSDGRLRVVTVAGEDLWMQGYDLESTSAQVLKCEKVNLLKFSATTAEAFDSTSAYAVGDRVIYGGMVYKFTAAHSAGAWVGTDAAVDSVSLTMPYVPVGKVGDFVLDVDNSANASVKMAAELSGLFTAFDVFVDKGRNLSDLLTFDGGEQCELYFTMTAFGTQAKPAWKVVKQVVEKQEAGS